MSNFPASIDTAATLYSPVDAFSSKPLETTATGAIMAGDSSINVANATLGFAATYGVLSIDNELITYTGRTGTSFTGCVRGAFGTTAAGHSNGAAIRANMVAGFITALQDAVVKIETELGTAAARNYVRKDGAVTCTGVKTFQDGAEFGAGTKAGTGLVRLPNTGGVKWRKADDSGDLGMSLNAANHLVMDAVIDFAIGQTFGAFAYPDATTASKGIVQIDPAGGIDVSGGVIALAASGVTPGTYFKCTVDAKGRVTVGAGLAAGDLPSHTHLASEISNGALPVNVYKATVLVGTRRSLNFIEGANITLTMAEDAGNDRVNITVAASAPTHNLLSATHPDTLADSPVLGDLIAANGTPKWARLAGNTTGTRKFLRQLGTGAVSALPAWDTLAAGDIPALDTAKLTTGQMALARGGTGSDLSATGPGFLKQTGGGAAVTVAALAAGDLPAHTHTSAQVSDATSAATASMVAKRDADGGANFAYVAANNLWAFLDSHLQSIECGAFGTVGGAFENMAKYSEDFTVATWDKNGGSCSAAKNATAPDGNGTACTVTAVSAVPLIQQQIAGLTDGGTYTFYVWARVASGTKQVSLAIVNNAYGAYLAGPTSITLTTSWQRFKITGTLAGGQTALWAAVRQFDANGDNWTSGAVQLWGACLQLGTDPKKGYARTIAAQVAANAAGIASGAIVITAARTGEAPLTIYGPDSPLTDKTVFQVLANGEVIIAGGTGNGYRLAEIVGASNPSGWAGMLKVKNPAGATAGYILLYTNP